MPKTANPYRTFDAQTRGFIERGLEAEMGRLNTQLQLLRSIREKNSPQRVKGATKRQLSPEARKALSDRMKARWAAKRKTTKG